MELQQKGKQGKNGEMWSITFGIEYEFIIERVNYDLSPTVYEINKQVKHMSYFNRVTMLKFFWFRILWWRRGVYLRWGLFSRSACVALPLSGVRDVWRGWGNSGPCSSDLWDGPHHCYNRLLGYWINVFQFSWIDSELQLTNCWIT